MILFLFLSLPFFLETVDSLGRGIRNIGASTRKITHWNTNKGKYCIHPCSFLHSLRYLERYCLIFSQKYSYDKVLMWSMCFIFSWFCLATCSILFHEIEWTEFRVLTSGSFSSVGLRLVTNSRKNLSSSRPSMKPFPIEERKKKRKIKYGKDEFDELIWKQNGT